MAKERQTLSVSMIVKNEILHIERVLDIALQFADEVIVVDTGSSDGTREAAVNKGVKVRDFLWVDHFAKARNESLRHCSMDFVMWLDADDVLLPDSIEGMKQLFSHNIDWDVLYLPYYYHYEPGARVKGKRKMPPRIWRNGLGIRWVHPIHENPSYPRRMRKERGVRGIEVLHNPLGSRVANPARNMRIMKKALKTKEYYEDAHMLWHMGKDLSSVGNYRQAVTYYKRALESPKAYKGFTKARIEYGLACQYRRLAHHPEAMDSAARAANTYSDWREPFCEIARALGRAGDVHACDTVLGVAAKIPRHELQVERAELYDDEGLSEFSTRLLKSAKQRAGSRMADTSSTPKEYSLVAGGDVCLGRQMSGWVSKNGSDWPLSGVKKVFEEADIGFANLEAATSTLGDFLKKGGKRPFYYRNRPDMLDVIIRGGINAVNVANNHAGDFGFAALEQQLEVLDDCGIVHCGAGIDAYDAASPSFVQLGDLTVALIGIDTETPSMSARGDRAGINYRSESDLLAGLAVSVSLARLRADLVFVTPHWGANWRDKPSITRRKLAKKIIDLGVDAIFGHSAHILQGVEVHRGRPIIYDMGTLLFDRVSANRMKVSALFEFTFTANGISRLKILPVWLQEGQARVAAGDEVSQVHELMKRLTAELDSSLNFGVDGNRLVLELDPSGFPKIPMKVFRDSYRNDLSRVKPVSNFYRKMPTNLEYDAVPEFAKFETEVVVNEWLTVIGARWGQCVRPDYGFLCETFFRVKRPLTGRWEAKITGEDQRGENKFSYTHPVGEGVIDPTSWSNQKVLGDRVVVRPPNGLPQGQYSIYWHLFERDASRRMPSNRRHKRLVGKRVYLGKLMISDDAPPGVVLHDSRELRLE
ncbi:CapA family protein [Wenzhouxiangella limi]|uniref:Glycosyltransferase n=1 Tax=Wenzhouxiangella limi TaxID=2707351 RepID=A0A845V2L0_9GAMM|nr:CapA family protein [Wenzhouxiangella limi]NDY95486.1 glycosyltransferase [Wenzhouxiangella limi]